MESQVPQTCTAITQEDLKKAGAGSVAETLRILPNGCAAPQNLSPFARDVLNAHNALRREVGAPALRWDGELAQHAQVRAEEIARIGQLVHAPREGRGTERENLSQGLRGWSAVQMMNNWFKEKRLFHAGKFPDVCDGDWSTCAHYSQAIWEATTAIGCGMASSVGFQWMVCRYNPGGNKDGKWVGTPVSIASNPTIRPRLIGGDYGNQACEGPPVDANGAIPINTADCEGVIKPTVDLVGDIGGHESAVESDSTLDDEFWAASVGLLANLSEDTRLELGAGYDDYDVPPAGAVGGGVYWDPVNQVTVGAGATWVESDLYSPDVQTEVDTKVEQPNVWGHSSDVDTKVGQPAPTATDLRDLRNLEAYLMYSSDAFTAQIAGLIGGDDPDLDWAVGGGATLSGSSDFDLITGANLGSSATGKLGHQGQFNTDVTDHVIYGGLTLSFDPNAVPEGGYVDTKVEQPKLPDRQTFKPPEIKPGDLDPL
jgi:hypothetical protein